MTSSERPYKNGTGSNTVLASGMSLNSHALTCISILAVTFIRGKESNKDRYFKMKGSLSIPLD